MTFADQARTLPGHVPACNVQGHKVQGAAADLCRLQQGPEPWQAGSMHRVGLKCDALCTHTTC
jgi:hypothetical protein